MKPFKGRMSAHSFYNRVAKDILSKPFIEMDNESLRSLLAPFDAMFKAAVLLIIYSCIRDAGVTDWKAKMTWEQIEMMEKLLKERAPKA